MLMQAPDASQVIVAAKVLVGSSGDRHLPSFIRLSAAAAPAGAAAAGGSATAATAAPAASSACVLVPQHGTPGAPNPRRWYQLVMPAAEALAAHPEVALSFGTAHDGSAHARLHHVQFYTMPKDAVAAAAASAAAAVAGKACRTVALPFGAASLGLCTACLPDRLLQAPSTSTAVQAAEVLAELLLTGSAACAQATQQPLAAGAAPALEAPLTSQLKQVALQVLAPGPQYSSGHSTAASGQATLQCAVEAGSAGAGWLPSVPLEHAAWGLLGQLCAEDGSSGSSTSASQHQASGESSPSEEQAGSWQEEGDGWGEEDDEDEGSSQQEDGEAGEAQKGPSAHPLPSAAVWERDRARLSGALATLVTLLPKLGLLTPAAPVVSTPASAASSLPPGRISFGGVLSAAGQASAELQQAGQRLASPHQFRPGNGASTAEEWACEPDSWQVGCLNPSPLLFERLRSCLPLCH